jgi:hypothetical protein
MAAGARGLEDVELSMRLVSEDLEAIRELGLPRGEAA